MKISPNIRKAVVKQIYNGLIIDAEFEDGSLCPVFCSVYDIIHICKKGTIIYVSRIISGRRKVKYELEFVVERDGLIYGRSNSNNNLFQEAFDSGLLSEFSFYTSCRRLEQNDNLPHIDFELSDSSGNKCYVFVTNVYLKYGGVAKFPNEVNFFELEMFEEMQKLRNKGYQTCVFIIAPFSACQGIQFSWQYSPLAAAKIFDQAKSGVKFIGYGCKIDKNNVSLSQPMPIGY